jgi:hypothetical protein
MSLGRGGEGLDEAETVWERVGVEVEAGVDVEVDVDVDVDVDSEAEGEMMEGEGGFAEWDGPGGVGVDDGGWSGSPLRIRNAVLSGP